MQVTLYIAPSIDGYIATSDQYMGEMYPIKDVLNIVLSSDSTRTSDNPNLVFVQTVEAALSAVADHGHTKALLIGGGTVNASFLAADLIDDLILDIHPLILGKGIKAFENIEKFVRLRRTSIKPMDDDLVQIRYQVIK